MRGHQCAAYPKVGSRIGSDKSVDVAVQDLALAQTGSRNYSKHGEWKAERKRVRLKREYARLLHGIKLAVGVDAHLDPRDNAEKTQGGRSSKPLIVLLLALDDANVSLAVDDVQLDGGGTNHGVFPDGGPVCAHGNAATQGDVPVYQGVIDRLDNMTIK